MTPFQNENFSDAVTTPTIFDHTVLCGYYFVIFLFFDFCPFGHKLVWSALFKHSSLLVLTWSIITFKYLFLFLLGFPIYKTPAKWFLRQEENIGDNVLLLALI